MKFGMIGSEFIHNSDKDWVKAAVRDCLPRSQGAIKRSTLSISLMPYMADVVDGFAISIRAIVPCKTFADSLKKSESIFYESLLEKADWVIVQKFKEMSIDSLLHAGRNVVETCDLLLVIQKREKKKPGYLSRVISYAVLKPCPMILIDVDKRTVICR